MPKQPAIPKEFIRDDSLVGFGVRVSPKGRITFIAEGRIRGQQTKRVTLGTYPAMPFANLPDLSVYVVATLFRAIRDLK